MKHTETTLQTKQKLMDAFWTLYQENGISKITVGAVTKLAGFNRSTFYEYFTDLYDLLNQLEESLLTDLKAEVEEAFSRGIPKEFDEFSQICARIFSRYGDRLFILIGAQGDSGFAERLKQWIRPTLESLFHLSDQRIPFDYLAAFIFSSVIGILNCWYESGKNIRIEELFEMSHALIANGVFGLIS